MPEIQGVKGELLGVTAAAGGFVLSLQFPTMGATSLYVPAGSVLEAVRKGHEHLVANKYGAHPVSDETGIWFGAEALRGQRAVEFLYNVSGHEPRLRVVDPGGEGEWSIELIPPAEPIQCSSADEDAYNRGRRAMASTGSVVRDKVTGRYGTLVGWPASGEWLVLFEPTPIFPAGHPDDLASRKRKQFCLADYLERDKFYARLSREARLSVNRMLRPAAVGRWGRDGDPES